MSKLLVAKNVKAVRVVEAMASRPRPRRRTRRGVNGTNNTASQYARTLVDPFEEGPMKLGFNTLIPTVLASGYLRSSFTVNADGTFAVFMRPCLRNMIRYNNGGAATTIYTAVNAVNESAIATQLTSARTVSMGLRLFALFPETAAPGVLVGGSIYASETDLSIAPTAFFGLASSELGIGSKGAVATGRPYDPSSVTFYTNTINNSGWTSNVLCPFTCCYVSGQGFPAGTIIWYEAVLNLEGIPSQLSTAIGEDQSENVSQPHNQYPNFETFVQAALRLVRSPVVMDSAIDLIGRIHPTTGRVMQAARHVLGTGRVARRAQLVAGRNVAQQSTRNTVVIEELSDHATGSSATRR